MAGRVDIRGLTSTAGTSSDRVPPQNLEAERAALGAMLLGDENGREAIAKAAVILKPRDFYRTAHQRIYQAVSSLFEQGEKADLITVAEWLRKNGELEQTGGSSYIAGLLDEIPIAANIEEYAQIIKDKATMRRLMEIGNGLYGQAAEDSVPVGDVLNDASQSLYDIAQERFRGGMRPLREMVLPEIEHIENISRRTGADSVTGLPTGFPHLDELTSGLQSGEFVVIAARPGQGKTSFVLNVVENVALKRQDPPVPVLVFSLEMSARDLVRRLLCAHARVDSHRVRRGNLFEDDYGRITQAAPHLAGLNVWIDDSSRLSPLELRAKARRLLGETGTKNALIVVDYIQLMDTGSERGMTRMENRQQEIAYISRSLKAVAKDLNVPVLVASQLSRAVEQRKERDPRPRLSDLRESGAIEQDADVVIFLYREAQREAQESPGAKMQGWVSQVVVAKQRNGPTGKFPLYFNRAFTRFDILEGSQVVPEEE